MNARSTFVIVQLLEADKQVRWVYRCLHST